MAIELPPDIGFLLERAAVKRGVTRNEFATQLIMRGLAEPADAAPVEKAAAVRALFANWAEEDAAERARMTPEEAAREEAEWQEFQRNIETGGVQLRRVDVSES